MTNMNHENTNKPTRLQKLLKDPLWLLLLAITSFAYMIVNDTAGYILATILLVFNANVIFKTYFYEDEPLKEMIAKELAKFNEDYIILPAIALSDGRLKGYSDFIIISPKGIFNLRALDFQGALTGYQNDELWEYIKATSPYDVTRKIIKNPIYFHQQTHDIIEALLEQQHIKYIPIQSLLVVNSNLRINTDSRIPVVKAEELHNYISEYADRSIMSGLKNAIEDTLKESVSSNIGYIPVSSK